MYAIIQYNCWMLVANWLEAGESLVGCVIGSSMLLRKRKSKNWESTSISDHRMNKKFLSTILWERKNFTLLFWVLSSGLIINRHEPDSQEKITNLITYVYIRTLHTRQFTDRKVKGSAWDILSYGMGQDVCPKAQRGRE